MISNQLTICLLAGGAALTTAALFVIILGPHLTRAWQRLTSPGRALVLLAAALLTLYAGTKPPTNTLMGVRRPLSATIDLNVLTCPSEIHAPSGYKLCHIFRHTYHSFDAGEGAVVCTNWFARGAASDWCTLPLTNGWNVALSGGNLRKTPLDIGSEVGFDDGEPLWCVPEFSRLWYAHAQEMPVVTWQDFVRGSNETLSVQVEFGDPFVVRTNDVAYVFGKTYNPTNDVSLDFSFDFGGSTVVFSNGLRRAITLSLHSREEVRGTVKVACDSDKITLWNSAFGGRELHDNDLAFNARDFVSRTFYAEYAATSETTNDIVVAAELIGQDYDDYGSTATSGIRRAEMRLTAAELEKLVLSCGETEVEFAPLTDYPIVNTNSWNAGRHLLVPYERAWNPTNGFRDCSVDAQLCVRPVELASDACWSLSYDSPPSGQLVQTDDGARLVNPRIGGHYKLTAEIDGVWATGNVLLPLAGAEIENYVLADLGKASHVAELIGDVSNLNYFSRRAYGYLWFFNFGRHRVCYYLGRPDLIPGATYWQYNQVNDNLGFGAICTLAGVPIRLEKLSNLSAGYLCKKINVPTNEVEAASHRGTENDTSATLSWSFGEDLATRSTNEYPCVISNMARACWNTTDEKLAKLWPLTPEAMNYLGCFTNRFDYNFHFASPTLLVNPDPYDYWDLLGTWNGFVNSVRYHLFH